MRENKFRAWDNVENKMYYTGEEELILFMFDSTGIVADKVIPDDSIEGFHAVRLDHLIYTEYTGLKDKNGVEIYEGDILQPSNNSKEYYVVTWTGEGFQRRYKFIRKYQGKQWEETTDLPIYPDAHKVVSNIYENPELLEVDAK